MEFMQQYKAARRVSTPLVAIRTFDAKSTLDQIRKALGDKLKDNSFIIWDIIHGMRALTDLAVAELGTITAGIEQEATADLATTLKLLERATSKCTVFISNAHLYWPNEPAVVQGIWNLRDSFKADGNMLVLLCSPGSMLPAELGNDVMVMDEPLPNAEEIQFNIKETFKNAKINAPDAETLQKATDALIGVPAFAAEQSTAMCLNLTKDGEKRIGTLDLQELWEHKRQVIAQTPGLSVYRGKETLEDIGGLTQVKKFFTQLMNGNDQPKAIIFIDEIEKAVAGAGTDMSGVKGEMHGTMLSWMQDSDIAGMLFIGLPGTSKSWFTKCGGNTFGRPTINFDLSGMQSGIIGSSGANLRQAQKTVDAISGSHTLAIATCNSINALSPELRARFTLGTFFFDAPDAEEKATIWKIHRAKFGIPADESNPNDDGWVGREINECCKKAYRLKITLAEAASYIIPVTRSSSELIHNLRQTSSGKYLSASKPGMYNYHGEHAATTAHPPAVVASRGRVLRTEEE